MIKTLFFYVPMKCRGGLWGKRILDKIEISEKPDKTEEKIKEGIANNITRYCFLKFKDVLGYDCRKFIGVYKAVRYDIAKKTEVWKLVSDTAELVKL